MQNFIEYELNAIPKTHSILDFINTLEQHKICGWQNAGSVRCPYSVDVFLGFPRRALYKFHLICPAEVSSFIYTVVKLHYCTYRCLCSFFSWLFPVLYSIVQLTLFFLFLQISLFLIMKNNLSHLISHHHFLLVKKSCIHLLASFENLEKLNFNFTIQGYLAWTLAWYTLMTLNTLWNDIAHSSCAHCLRDILGVN